jgi:hypothetical protein
VAFFLSFFPFRPLLASTVHLQFLTFYFLCPTKKILFCKNVFNLVFVVEQLFKAKKDLFSINYETFNFYIWKDIRLMFQNTLVKNSKNTTLLKF